MYLYETHCHTSEVSKCGKLTAAEMVDWYHGLGYTGVTITDHFFNGNCAVPKHQPWEARVEQFLTGYENAKVRGEELGMDILLGWEFTVLGTDFLTYGLDAAWLYRNPYCDQIRASDYANLVHADGGYIIQAHPFREANYIEMIRLLPRHCDAVEVFNACRKDFENQMAEQYAANYGLPRFVGTDNHRGERERYAAVELPARTTDSGALVRMVIAGEAKLHMLADGTDTVL